MRYLTDRKRAQGMGASRNGTQHHWQMIVSSIYLMPMVPLFLFVFGVGFGGSYQEVTAFFSRPFPAIVTGLSVLVIINHAKYELQEAIEDYVHGVAGKLSLIACNAFAYIMMAVAIYALIRLAL